MLLVKLVCHICLRFICFNQCLCFPCTPAFPSSPLCCLSSHPPPLLFPEGPVVNFDLHRELVKCLCNPYVCICECVLIHRVLQLPCPCVHVCNPQVSHSGDILSWPIRSSWLITQASSLNSPTNKLFPKAWGQPPSAGSILWAKLIIQHFYHLKYIQYVPWGVYRRMKNYETSLHSPSSSSANCDGLFE